ncbi:hypothetical protein LOAG_08205 [Loa loa]|uniref:Uncharacterized protein n=1 Tax=Loa loa TaxID=7209 RepID=A0A1S0TVQ4_LOALO|nr:hypothetical protein LOAG_08205 [Loa loa]EFO20286.1 hypothetical protein LOAG_08205 [Loa loa]
MFSDRAGKVEIIVFFGKFAQGEHSGTSLNAYCCPGPPNINQPMGNVHVGSPDAWASWNEPTNNSNFDDFQM